MTKVGIMCNIPPIICPQSVVESGRNIWKVVIESHDNLNPRGTISFDSIISTILNRLDRHIPTTLPNLAMSVITKKNMGTMAFQPNSKEIPIRKT